MAASFVKQNALGFVSQSLGLLTNLVFNIVFPVFLGALVFGKLSISLGFAYLLAGLFDAGFNNSCIRFISKYKSEKNHGKLASSFWALFKMKLGVSLIIAVALFFCSSWLAEAYGVPALSVQLASALIVLVSGVSFLISFFTGINKNQISLLGTLVNAIMLIVLPIAFYFAGFRLNGIIAAVALSFFVAFVFLMAKALAELRGMKIRKTAKVGGIARSVFGFSAVSFANIFAVWGILLVLGLFVASESVAFFKVSISWILAVVSIVPISSSVVFSYFMQARSPQKLFSYIQKTVRYSLIIIVPAMFGLFLVGPKAVSVIYGPSYVQAGAALTLMCWAILPYFMNNIFLSIITALGKLQKASKVYAASLVIGIAFSFALSSAFGLTGAVASFVLLNYLIFILSYFIVRKEGFRLEHSSLVKPLIASLVMSAFVYFALPLVSSLYAGIALIIAGIIVYFVSLYAVKGININDVSLVKSVVK